jgi:hypothetical protein
MLECPLLAFNKHRDGSEECPLRDADGNLIEARPVKSALPAPFEATADPDLAGVADQ